MKYLITGLPASGKTTVGKELKNHGFDFIDSDEYPGLARWYCKKSGEPAKDTTNKDARWYDEHDWNWDIIALEKILMNYEDRDIAVCSITSNIGDAFHLFDKIFLLKTDYNLLRKRLAGRSDNPDYESNEAIFTWAKSFEDEVIKNGGIVIDSTVDISKTIDAILNS